MPKHQLLNVKKWRIVLLQRVTFCKPSCSLRTSSLRRVTSSIMYFGPPLTIFFLDNWLQVWLKFTIFSSGFLLVKTRYYINLEFQNMSLWYLLLETLSSRNTVHLKEDFSCFYSHCAVAITKHETLCLPHPLHTPLFTVCKTHLNYWLIYLHRLWSCQRRNMTPISQRGKPAPPVWGGWGSQTMSQSTTCRCLGWGLTSSPFPCSFHNEIVQPFKIRSSKSLITSSCTYMNTVHKLLKGSFHLEQWFLRLFSQRPHLFFFQCGFPRCGGRVQWPISFWSSSDIWPLYVLFIRL